LKCIEGERCRESAGKKSILIHIAEAGAPVLFAFISDWGVPADGAPSLLICTQN
jgi:hypothetical protein